MLWELFDELHQSKIIKHLDEDVILSLLSNKSGEQIATVLEQTDDDDTADILQQLPADLIKEVLPSSYGHPGPKSN
jgi:Mg/Co/Ni transporter MgtE